MKGLTDNQLLIQYLEGTLPTAEQSKVASRLDQEPALRQEFMQLQELYAQFDNPEQTPVPSRVEEGFYTFLDQVQHFPASQEPRRIAPYWKWTAAAAAVLISISLLSSLYLNWTQQEQLGQMQAEIERTQRMLMLSMLENPSASNRMQAMGVSLKQIKRDDEVLDALRQVLDYDPNVNVRLKAANALAEFIEEPGVMDLMIASLEKQTFPQVQIVIIEILTEARKKEAINAFHKLLEREELMNIVRDKAAEGIGVLL